MRKGVTVAVVLLAAAITGLPWTLGSRAQGIYENALTGLQEQGIRVLDSEYRRGWFVSDASVEIELPQSSARDQGATAIPLRLSNQISHGPWTLRSPRLLPSAALIDSRVELSIPGIEPPPLYLTTRVELNGSGLTLIRLPKISRQSAGLVLETEEGAGEVQFSRDFATAEGWFELPSLSLSSQEGVRIDLVNLRAGGSGARWVAGLSTGEGTLRLERAELTAPDASLLAVGLSASGKSVPDGELLSVELAYRIDDLTLDGAAYGPSQLSFSVRRLPGDVLADIQRAMQEITASRLDESLVAVAMAAVFAEHLPRLLAYDPELALEGVRIGTPQGVIEGQLSIASRGLTTEDLQTPGGWLERLVGRGEMSLPRPAVLRILEGWQHRRFLEQLKRQGGQSPTLPEGLETEIASAALDQLDALVAQGWLAEKEDTLTTALRLEDALLTVNGKSIPVGAAAVVP